MRQPATAQGLAEWLDWLKIGTCHCSFKWASMGQLDGISMGKGWIRTNTRTACPHHGVKAQADWDARQGHKPRQPVR